MLDRSPLRPLILAALLLATTAAVPALADFRVERELAMSPSGTFVLEADSGAIEIRGTSRGGARVVVTADRDDLEERYQLSFEERGDDAVVRVEKRGGWTRRMFSGSYRLRFEVEVPRGADVDLSTAGGAIDARSIGGRLEARSSGGSIDVEDAGGDIDVHTSGGPISVSRVGGDARLDTSGGGIRAREVAGDLVAETSGGSIQVDGVGGSVKAHTSGGPVRATFAAGNGSGGSLSTSGGGITVTLNPTVALDIDAHTSGGRVTIDLPITTRGSYQRNSVRGQLNGGGPLLKLRSSGGSIRLQGR